MFIRLAQLASTKNSQGLLPLAKATVWRYTAAGLLPKPLHLGPRITAWPKAEIDAVIEARSRGATELQIKALVLDLHKQRGAL
jgi:prophage regulatory protein